jgi:hypothetical protein
MTINAFQKAAQQAEKLTGSTGITCLLAKLGVLILAA